MKVEASSMKVEVSRFYKDFWFYRERASKKIMKITHHGKIILVMLPVDEYDRLEWYDKQKNGFKDRFSVKVEMSKFHKDFGFYQEQAIKGPVEATYHGKTSFFMLSADEYNRLKSYDDRKAYYAWETPEEVIKAIENRELPEECKALNYLMED